MVAMNSKLALIHSHSLNFVYAIFHDIYLSVITHFTPCQRTKCLFFLPFLALNLPVRYLLLMCYEK
jgi:hypothetical protein